MARLTYLAAFITQCDGAAAFMMVAKGKVMLVEDNPDDVLLIRRSFKRLGLGDRLLAVPTAERAVEALTAASKRPNISLNALPKLILLDLQLPGMDGFQFLSWLRTSSDSKELPVVVLTGSAFSPHVQRAYELGANSFMVKPTDSDLTAVLSHILEPWLDTEEPAEEPSENQPCAAEAA